MISSMRRITTLCSSLLAFGLLGAPLLSARETIHVSAIDWCPQICPKTPERPGYLVEMIQDLYRKAGYELDFEYVPWSRAIVNVRTGRTDGLLSPSKDEAPDLEFHAIPLAYQTHCFWKLSTSSWSYTDLESLNNTKFIIYRDHSYGPFLFTPEHKIEPYQYFELSYDEHYIDRAIALLKAGRAETFLFTANSVQYYLNQQHSTDVVMDACFKRDELWFALSPKSDKLSQMRQVIDDTLAGYKRTNSYEALLARYHIRFPELIQEQRQAESEIAPAGSEPLAPLQREQFNQQE